MDFELNQEQKMLQDSIRKFVEKEVKPLAAEIDAKHSIPTDLVNKISEMGMMGAYIPETYGGAGMDILSYVILVEEVSKACGSTGILISAHNSLACNPVLQFGNDEQKKKFLPLLAGGKRIGCLLLTEPGAGSDVAGIATTYRETSDGFVLNGSKLFITNGGYRGIGIIIASKDRDLKYEGLSAFIVDLESPGVIILKNEEKLGIRGSSTTSFALDNLMVPKENLLGEEGKGFKIAMDTLNGGRIGVGAQALGIAEGAFERALAYSKERQQFGGPISELQAVKFKLADMHTRIETSRLIVYRAAWLKDQHRPFAAEAAMCKMYASEAAAFVTDEAIQIHGGYGYINDYEVERMYRDARITRIYEGTNEVQRLVIARALLSDK
jgi:butyryl-CoA dehydrogenase